MILKMEEEIHFKHTFPVQLRFSDVDQLGHVNNSVYFSLYDLAKTAYFTDVIDENWHKSGIVIANIQANFILPIFFRESIAIQTTTVRLGNKSLTLLQRAVNTETGEVKCTCQTVMVGYDMDTKQSQPIPGECKQAIYTFEERDSLNG